jgi:hypothetical protein
MWRSLLWDVQRVTWMICFKRLERTFWPYLQRSKGPLDFMDLKADTTTPNIEHQSLSDATPNPRRTKTSTVPLRKPEKSHKRKRLTHGVAG